MADLSVCFVIMPFSETRAEHPERYWTSHFTDFLKPLIEEHPSLQAKRSSALRGDLRNEIVTELITAPIVVADLTDSNPNVYWELGVRQSFRHGTITIAQVGTKLPFDIGSKGTLFYEPTDHLKIENFRSQFKRALANCVDEPSKTDSLVLEVVSGRGSIFELVRKDEAVRRVDALMDELSFNLKQVDAIVTRAKTNQDPKNKGNRSYHTTLLRHSCCELLMTTRYLDEPIKFYHTVERGFGKTAMFNAQLAAWEHKPANTEAYLIDQADDAKKVFTTLRTDLTTIGEGLRARV
jgi:hypothetical protein